MFATMIRSNELTSGDLHGMFIFFGTMLLFLLIFGLIYYVLFALAISKVGKKEGFENHWFGWIPVLNAFVIPMMVKNRVHPMFGANFVGIYVGVYIGAILLSVIPFLGVLIALAPMVLYFYAFYALVKPYSSSASIHLIVAVLTCGISMPFSMFMLK